MTQSPFLIKMIKLREAINEKIKFWDNNIKGASTERLGLRLLRDKKRWLCCNDLFYLACLTGQDKIGQFPDFYKPYCEEISLLNWQVIKLGIHKTSQDLLKIEEISDNPKKDFEFLQRLYLCYRTWYKTTIITKLHSLQLLLNFPNIHILIAHNTFINASRNMLSVKEFFLSTTIKHLFPEYISHRKDWGNIRGFSVANRTDKARDEENITAVGVDTEITGGHWQIAKKNDLVTEESVNTEEQIQKVKDWDDRFNIGHFDDPHINLQDYEGTRYHFADLYSEKKGNPRIKLTEIPLLKDKDDNASCIHPARFKPEDIQKIKDDKKKWVFMCQMQQTPEDPEKMQFNRNMIAYYSSIPEHLHYYLLVDPAAERKKKSDFTVMKVVGVGLMEIDDKIKKVKLVVDAIRDKLDPKQRVDRAMELAEKWRIKACGWEAIGFQTTDCFYFEELRRKKKLFFDITEIKSQNVSKNDRIRSLIPEYAEHEWLWPEKGQIVKTRRFDGKSYDITEEMEFELLQFPLCKHDDLLDAQTFLKQIDVIYPEEQAKTKEPTEMTFGEYGKNIELRKELDGRKNPYDKLLESRV